MKTNDCVVRRWRRLSASVLIALVTVGVSLTQGDGIAQGDRTVFPGLIQLPAGFGPEGIAVGHGHRFYVGSFVPATRGQILVGDLRSGTFAELVPPTGRMAVGMKIDPSTNFLFVAGGTSGAATVYDADTGAQIALYQFQPAGVNGLNDVVVTRQAAYFTDTTRPFLYRVALEPDGQPGTADVIPLPANFGVRGGCTIGSAPRANGIAAAANGKHLIVIHMSEGQLYLLDTDTLTPIPIDITGGDFAGGSAVCDGDGLLLDGRTLYVAQPSLSRVAVVELSPDHLSGFVTRYITEPFASNPALRIPTTIAEFGNSLYAVTFGGQPPTPDFVVRLSK